MSLRSTPSQQIGGVNGIALIAPATYPDVPPIVTRWVLISDYSPTRDYFFSSFFSFCCCSATFHGRHRLSTLGHCTEYTPKRIVEPERSIN